MSETNPINQENIIEKDVAIIGAGPVGLFAVFELGLVDLKAVVIDILDKPGGQCAELYPEKPIYDIPAYPTISGQELTDKLMEQIAPFSPEFLFSRMVMTMEDISEKTDDNPDATLFRLTTDQGDVIIAKNIVIAAGGGSFQPKRPSVPNIEDYEGQSLFYSVKKKDQFKNKNLVILGGGDSALDWAVNLQPLAKSVTLVHRRAEFRAALDTVNKFMALVDEEKAYFQMGQIQDIHGDNGMVSSISIKHEDEVKALECDCVLAFFGLTMRPGPIAEWGIELENNLFPVDTEKFETSRKGIFAIGDINSYPGKLKLILSGFHEAALMSHAAFAYCRPDKKLRFQYTTSSSNLQKKLGVK